MDCLHYRCGCLGYEEGAGEMREIEVTVDTEEIEKFFFQELIKRGFVPSENEIGEIADIVFEYLVAKKIIDEED
jgi:YozD-like protein